MYSVYIHTNKLNGKKYVGITKQKPERRWQNGHGYRDNDYFYKAILKYGWDGFKHEIVKDGLAKEEACSMEIELIEKYECTNREKGYNVSAGGETGLVNIMRGKDNPKSTAINVYDEEGNFIAKYETQTATAEALRIKRQGIGKCCTGQVHSYRGYIFEYADKEFDKTKVVRVRYKHKKKTTIRTKLDGTAKIGRPPETMFKKVICIDTGTVYNSLKEAGEITGVRRCHISNVCRGERKTAGGLRWQYA